MIIIACQIHENECLRESAIRLLSLTVIWAVPLRRLASATRAQKKTPHYKNMFIVLLLN